MCQVYTFYGQDTIRIPSNFPKIQDALDIAKTNTVILVAPGTYYENLVWPSDIDGISMIGSEGSAVTIIDGGNIGRVIQMVAPNPGTGNNLISQATLLKGFTIQHGKTISEDGAGLRCFYANPKLEDLRIIHNEGSGSGCVGAGAYLFGYSGVIKNCEVSNNRITASGTANAPGMAIVYLNDVSVTDCSFLFNTSFSGINSSGGGLLLTKTANSPAIPANIRVTNCRFDQNAIRATNLSNGGGLFMRGNLSEDQTSLFVENCIFYQNEAKLSGGAMYGEAKNINIKQCLFFNNTALSGGGMFVNKAEKVDITWSRFTQNEALAGAGLYLDVVYTNKVRNSRFDHNRSLPDMVVKGSAIYDNTEYSRLILENVVLDHNAENPVMANDNNLEMIFCTSYMNEKSTFGGKMEVYIDNSILWNLPEKEATDQNIDFAVISSLVKGEEPGFLILNENPLMVSDEIPVPTLLSPCINFGEILSLEINQDVQGYPRTLPSGSQPDIGAYEVDQYNSFVTVRYFYDKNQNGSRENDEPWLRFGRTTDHKGKTYVNTSEKGSKIFLRPGNQMVSYLEDPFGEWKLTNEKDHTFFVNSWEFQRDISFGLFPLKAVSQLSSFMASDPVRCGKRSNFVIAASNTGTTTSDGQLRLRLDENINNITFVDLPDITISDLEYGWNFVGLEPGQVLAKSFFIKAPDQIVPGHTETVFSFCHHISGFTDTETNCYQAPVHCKDVSDEKVATPQHEDFHHLIDRPLTYTIRFQNTGIDFARNVIIRDVIDTSFDITSLKILHTSHEEVLSVFYDDVSRQVSFEFKNIFQTDSFTHSEESRGYVTYSVINKKEVPLLTVVENKAQIIFDNFIPKVTNTTKNILVDKIISFVDNENIFPIQVFPNPTSDKVSFSQKVDLAELYTLQGQCIQKSASTDHLMTDFPTGIYILRLTSEGKVSSYKITVVK
jgi:hypothetical protein